MSRENDKKIAEWLGNIEIMSFEEMTQKVLGRIMEPGFTIPGVNRTVTTDYPHYSTSDAAAVTLLPVLAEKGYVGSLGYNINGYDFSVIRENWGRNIVQQPSIAAAISAAVVELIESI